MRGKNQGWSFGSRYPAPKATLKKKFVFCPAGGNNNGQSGGRKIFFFIYIFSPCIEMVEKMLGGGKKTREM